MMMQHHVAMQQQQPFPSVSPAPMHHPFPALSPMGMMAGGQLMMRPVAAPTHNQAFLQQHHMAMMAMRPPFGALPGQPPGKISTIWFILEIGKQILQLKQNPRCLGL
jgi:hypothetical protein